MPGPYGYAGRFLLVNLGTGAMETTPDGPLTDAFSGGRGLGARLYWEDVPPGTKAFDPANCLVFANGPVAGVMGLAGSRWQVSGKAPLLAGDAWSYANFGGSWGAWLKYAGYDAVEIAGQSERPVYLFIEDGRAEIRDASALWGKGTLTTRELLKAELGMDTRVAAIGPAGEARAAYATILADEDASGSSGFGAVMGSKKLKAIAIRTQNRQVPVADPERVGVLGKRFRELSRGSRDMYGGGGGPRSPGYQRLNPGYNPRLLKAACRGCGNGCPRSWYTFEDGQRVKILCVSAAFYGGFVVRRDKTWNDNAFRAGRICNDYGLDTNSLMPLIQWLDRAFKAGALTEEFTGLRLSDVGSLSFLEDLALKISRREGFGDALADGIIRAAEAAGPAARALVRDIFSRTGQIYPYEPREWMTTGLLYPMEPRLHTPLAHEVVFPAHWWLDWYHKAEGSYLDGDILRGIARDFLGGEDALDFSTYAGKARAARLIQDRVTAKECLVMCDFAWPVTESRDGPGHRGDPALMAQVFSAVTGTETDEAGLNRLGERVFNLQRAISMREGHSGRKGDRLEEFEFTEPLAGGLGAGSGFRVPGKDAALLSRAGAVVDRNEFEKMKDDYYASRGWDVATGFQTLAKLEELKLSDIGQDLKKINLAV